MQLDGLDSSTKATQEPAESRSATRWLLPVAVLVNASLLLAIFKVFPESAIVIRSSGTELLVLNPAAASALWWGIAIFTLLLLFLSPLAWRQRRRWLCGFIVVFCLLFVPWMAIHRGLEVLSRWHLQDRVSTSDGDEFALLASSFLQGRTAALVRPMDSGLLYDRFDVLEMTSFDDPQNYVLLVRPQSHVRPDVAGVYIAGGFVLGVLGTNECHLAYEVDTQRAISGEAIRGISPFVLINATDAPIRNDVARIDEVMANESMHARTPSRSVLERALQHENPTVRDLAAKWLVMMDEVQQE